MLGNKFKSLLKIAVESTSRVFSGPLRKESKSSHIFCHMDYWNHLLTGFLDSTLVLLWSVLNTAARVSLFKCRSDWMLFIWKPSSGTRDVQGQTIYPPRVSDLISAASALAYLSADPATLPPLEHVSLYLLFLLPGMFFLPKLCMLIQFSCRSPLRFLLIWESYSDRSL